MGEILKAKKNKIKTNYEFSGTTLNKNSFYFNKINLLIKTKYINLRCSNTSFVRNIKLFNE